MFHLQGKVRDYNPSADTATIEFEGIGSIESWYDGLRIDPALNRAYLVHGAPVTLQTPDQFRLCEAIVVGLGDSFTTTSSASSAGSVTNQSGRSFLSTSSAGSGSVSVTFPTPYTTAPTLTTAADNHHTGAISNLTASGFTYTVTGGPANSYVYFTWFSTGH